MKANFYTGILKLRLVIGLGLLLSLPLNLSAHCDSYDGPLIKDAIKALENNRVNLVLKWVDEKYDAEITSLFDKTYKLKNGDKEIYAIVEKHFLETLVRLHRDGEGAAYTGLKPAGSTEKIIILADDALKNGSIDNLNEKLLHKLELNLKEKFEKVSEASKVKDNSVELGRKYVAAYVEYTHYLEAVHGFILAQHHHENEGHE